jgi:charged multivesicular body protein 4A/B
MQGVDETELEDELEALQQEELDNRMLATGTVPVGDKVGAMPSAPQGGKQNCTSVFPFEQRKLTIVSSVKGKAPAVEEDEEEAELRKLQAEMAL